MQQQQAAIQPGKMPPAAPVAASSGMPASLLSPAAGFASNGGAAS